MKQKFVFLLVLTASTFGHAQDVGRVIYSTPVVQQIATPQLVCDYAYQPYTYQRNTGGGAVVGAVVGGVLGNAFGMGAGKAAATAIGVIGGAAIGDRIERDGVRPHYGHNCRTETMYETRTVAYNVRYELAGKQYTTQMSHNPGPSVNLQVTPVGWVPPPMAYHVSPNSYITSAYQPQIPPPVSYYWR